MMHIHVRRSRSSERGSTAVEFAMTFVPIIWLVGVILETGLFLTAQYELQSAVVEASRQIRTGPVANSTVFKAALCQHVVMIRNCTSTVSVYTINQSPTTAGGVTTPGTFAGLKSAMRDPLTVGPTAGSPYTETFQPGGANVPGATIVTYDWPLVVPFIGSMFANLPGNNAVRRLYGVAVYKSENYT